MINVAKAYLKTEGNVAYRDCGINYYTYTMENQLNKFKIIVNVELHHTQNNFVKTLPLDDSFDKDADAINYGIDQGKKFIDNAYTQGKVNIVTVNPALQAKNDKQSKAKTDKAKAEKK